MLNKKLETYKKYINKTPSHDNLLLINKPESNMNIRSKSQSDLKLDLKKTTSFLPAIKSMDSPRITGNKFPMKTPVKITQLEPTKYLKDCGSIIKSNQSLDRVTSYHNQVRKNSFINPVNHGDLLH